MRALAYFGLGFAPGLFLLWYTRRRDVAKPEPTRMLLRVFFLGVLSVGPALVLEVGLFQALGGARLAGLPSPFAAETAGAALLRGFLIAALPEETCKLLAVWVGAYRSRHFDEKVDGIIYAAAAALGFASLENVFYIYRNGASVIVARAFLSTLGHLGFTGVAGYHLGLAKFDPTRAPARVAAGLGLAVLLHGSYDFFCFLDVRSAFLALPVTIFTIRYLSRRVHLAVGEDLRRARTAARRDTSRP